jgi:hypothetical protein
MKRPNTLVEVAQRVNSGTSFGLALSEFLDEFYGKPDRRQAMIAEEPARLADNREHAILGAVGEHLARRWNLTVPAWTDGESRFA